MKSDLVHRFHGENGITYSVFSALKTPAQVRRFLKTVRWESPPHFPDESVACEIHLFPSFGRRWGLGEPDALIITPDAVIFVEVETDQVPNLSGHFCKQIANFVQLSRILSEKSGHRLRGILRLRGGRKVRGLYKTRKLVNTLLSRPEKKDRKHFFLIIAEGRANSRKVLLQTLEDCRSKVQIDPEQIGWLSLSSIARMRWLPPDVIRVMTWNRKK